MYLNPINLKLQIKKFFYNYSNPSFIILFIFLIVIFRQYFWFTDFIFFAWIVPFIISLKLSSLIIKKLNYSKINLKFILIVWTPLLFFYLLRFSFPDSSFDIINYHFINGERGLNGYPFLKGDFFYLSYTNPASDMVTGITRNLLGHRVGTIINLFALFWSSQILEKIISKIILKKNYIYLIVSILLIFEGLTYQISNYWVEILSIPIILELVFLLAFKNKKDYFDYLIISSFLGILFIFKLINLVVILPFSFLFLIQFVKDIKISIFNQISKLIFIIIVFCIPIIPYHFYIFNITGNPIYPHLNWVFQSDLWSSNFYLRYDQGIGPKNNIEALIWPFKILISPERISNTPVYPFLTFFGYIISIITLLTHKYQNKKNYNIFYLCLFYLLSVFLWGFLSGDFRFVYYFEILGGIIIFNFLYQIIQNKKYSLFKLIENKQYANSIIFFLFFVLILKFLFTFKKANLYEWAERPSVFQAKRAYLYNLKYLFKDYHLASFLSDKDKELLQTKAWISSSPVVSGYMVLLNNKIPYIDLHHLSFRGKVGKKLFYKTIKDNGPKVYTSIINEGVLGWDLEKSIDDLKKHGFIPLKLTRFNLPFYSHSNLQKKKLLALDVVHHDYIDEINSKYSSEEINIRQSTIVGSEWLKGCSILEKDHFNSWQWCEDKFILSIKNFSNVKTNVQINFNIKSTSKTLSSFKIIDNLKKHGYLINNVTKNISKSIEIPPNKNVILNFSTNAPRLKTTDPRKLHVMITNFTIETNNKY